MPSGSTYISDSVLSLHFAKTLILKLKFLNTQGFSRIQSLRRRTDNSALTTPANRDKQDIKQAWLNLSFRLYFFRARGGHNHSFAETKKYQTARFPQYLELRLTNSAICRDLR